MSLQLAVTDNRGQLRAVRVRSNSFSLAQLQAGDGNERHLLVITHSFINTSHGVQGVNLKTSPFPHRGV